MIANEAGLSFSRAVGGNGPGFPAWRCGRVSHAARRQFTKLTAVHVTIAICPGVPTLRTRRAFAAVVAALRAARGRFGLRVIEFAVLRRHVHLLVEAESSTALARGMQGLNVRIAKSLNRAAGRRGPVLDDHYEARLLTRAAHVVRAIREVLDGGEPRSSAPTPDRYASLALRSRLRDGVLCTPRTSLLRNGWGRADAGAGTRMARDASVA